ncbi:M13 family metallopeptidase [Sphingomonas crusticola]|uniref:M13 family metallopeptidase n=1 Tax=Sphingomonas crusticola TaxID=1697973 RepID=UPI000E26A6E5|nr:M13 family metallopeptidase [Sphingomonas crusticola]
MKMSLKGNVALVALVLALSPALAAQAAQPKFGTWGVDYPGMDKAVKPGDDFWSYANGTWNRTTQFAPDRASAGVGVVLADQAEIDVRDIVDGLAKDPNASGVDRKVGAFYGAWMNQAAIDAAGTRPLQPYLAKIDAVKTRDDLVRLFATPGYAAPIGVGIIPDFADPTHYVAFAGQADLGLPDRDYYLLPGAKYDAIRAAYRAYVVKIQQLAGFADAQARADRIIALETRLATDQWPVAKRRDIQAIYHPMDRAKLTALAPQFNWPLFLDVQGLGNIPTVIAAETSAITAAGQRLDDVPLSTWREYLAYRFVSDNASVLPKAFDDARFDFYSHTLNDVPVQRERWKRGVQMVNGAMGEAVGQAYIARHYPPESERQMAELIENLRSAYADKIGHATWMDDATRKEALAKLAAFEPRTGHPVKYIDYSTIQISPSDPLANAINAQDFQWKLELSRLGKPVDRSLWTMTPQTVNAYYNPLMNQITFPAAILQPPYFDPAADPAVNYGEIGAIIGHEMGHGFDDQGRKFDASGHLRDWWSKGTSDSYTARAQRLVGQYNGYEPIPGTKINGQLTLGENLGDLGGLEASYQAYRHYVAEHGEPKVIDGYSGDQRFFLAFAQAWRSKRREGALRQQLLTDPHSPAEFRVNGIVRNVDAWYAAFNVKPGDKLYLPPEERVHVW